MKKIAGFIVLGVLAAGFLTPVCWAKPSEELTLDAGDSLLDRSDVKSEETRHQGPFNKLGRGITNVLTSPGEYVVQMVDMSQGNDPFTAFFGGLFKGTVYMAGRILNGAYDIVTFPVPLPKHYRPLWRPATVFEAWREIN